MTIILLTYTIALAAAGDLDVTFGGDGKVTMNIRGGGLIHDSVNGIAIQSDGKIVVAGLHYNNIYLNGDFAVARVKSNGTLDTTFSGDGKLTTDFGGTDYAYDVVLQSNGKIIVSGKTCKNYKCDLALARYNPNGSLDTTFSEDGKVTKDFGGGDNGSQGGIVIQPDGKIVVAGHMHNGSDMDFAVYRFNSNGTLDTTFHSDGMVSTGFGSGRSDYSTDLKIQTGGKIVVAGYAYGGDNKCNFAIARFNPNGSLDTTFSGDGKVTTDFGGEDTGMSVAVQSNGKIVVAGYSDISDEGRIALVRYNTTGILDTTFSGDGKAIANPAPSAPDSATSLAILSDGKLVVAGDSGNYGTRDFIFARFISSGILDHTFSGNGWLVTDFGGDDSGNAIVLQLNGRLVVAGRTNAGAGGDYDFALARYLP